MKLHWLFLIILYLKGVIIKMAQVIICNSCGRKSVTITCSSADSKGRCTACGGTTFHYEEVNKNDV